MVICMGKYVTQKDIEKLIGDVNKALLFVDTVIEVICEHYLKVDKDEFGKYVNEALNKRVQNIDQTNNLENKKED